VLTVYLQDNDRAMTLDAAGTYSAVPADAARVSAQSHLLRHYTERTD